MLRRSLSERHTKFGYDPLDREMIKERSTCVSAEGTTPRTVKRKCEREIRVRRLLRDHLEYCEGENAVFHHTFKTERLGFSILIARYGEEGRM